MQGTRPESTERKDRAEQSNVSIFRGRKNLAGKEADKEKEAVN